MNRYVTALLATVLIASPLAAQAGGQQKAAAKKDSAHVQKGRKGGAAAGEVAKSANVTAQASKDSTQKDSVAAAAADSANAKKDSAAANAAIGRQDTIKDPSKSLPPRRPTFKCKDGTAAFAGDSLSACGMHGGVDSVYKKP